MNPLFLCIVKIKNRHSDLLKTLVIQGVKLGEELIYLIDGNESHNTGETTKKSSV